MENHITTFKSVRKKSASLTSKSNPNVMYAGVFFF